MKDVLFKSQTVTINNCQRHCGKTDGILEISLFFFCILWVPSGRRIPKMWADYIYGVMMTSRAFPPRGIVHIPDVNANNQQSDWSNEDKRASRTVLCRRQLKQTTRSPSFSVFTSTRLLEVHLLPNSPISYNLNKMANRKTLTIAQMFNFKSWWCFPGCYPCYWSVKLPLKYLFLIISECSKIISCLTQDGFDCSQVLPSGLFSRVTERPVKAF